LRIPESRLPGAAARGGGADEQIGFAGNSWSVLNGLVTVDWRKNLVANHGH
jgi:hypothetical protein